MIRCWLLLLLSLAACGGSAEPAPLPCAQSAASTGAGGAGGSGGFAGSGGLGGSGGAGGAACVPIEPSPCIGTHPIPAWTCQLAPACVEQGAGIWCCE